VKIAEIVTRIRRGMIGDLRGENKFRRAAATLRCSDKYPLNLVESDFFGAAVVGLRACRGMVRH
jgi:hypothetical protein